MSPDVVVVGGGVIGASVAFHLAETGASVTLLERGDVAGEASGAAAGMLLPLGEAREKGPFLSLGLRSLALFPDLAETLHERSGIDPEYEPCGALHVARGAVRADALREKARDLPDTGAAWIGGDDARGLAPLLASDVVGALWSPAEAHVRSPKLVRAYLGAAAARGARVEPGVAATGLALEGDRVVGVITPDGTRAASAVVLCTGAWTPQCAGWVPGGPALPIEPVRGQIVVLDARRPPDMMLVGDDVYLVPKRDGRLVAGATEERVGFDDRVTAEGVALLLRRAFALAPGLAHGAFAGAWSGLRPATSDGLPAVGAVPGTDGLFVAAGHHRNGVLLSPLTGELIAALVTGAPAPDDAAPLDPGRFGLREPAG